MTRLLVLGLLVEQPMSGYDIQQKIIGADAERWGRRAGRFHISRTEKAGTGKVY